MRAIEAGSLHIFQKVLGLSLVAKTPPANARVHEDLYEDTVL
jgi:hypothetical protein